jgi:hypothetical protein
MRDAGDRARASPFHRTSVAGCHQPDDCSQATDGRDRWLASARPGVLAFASASMAGGEGVGTTDDSIGRGSACVCWTAMREQQLPRVLDNGIGGGGLGGGVSQKRGDKLAT